MERVAGDPTTSMDALTADFEVRFPGGARVGAAFELALKPPGVLILVGRSGAGKTTLLRALAGLERPIAGQIRYGDTVWSDPARGIWRPPQARRVGLVFQDYALFPHLTVEQNVSYGLTRLARAERRARVAEICARLGLEGLEARRPGQLSGGQQQRVALARVLVCRPRLLLLDEPFAALDVSTREEVRSYLIRSLRVSPVPTVLVTHDWVDALSMGDTMVVLEEGRVLQRGTPEEVLSRPATLEVAAIAGVETVVGAAFRAREEGTLRVSVGSVELVGMDPGGGSGEFWVCIRGEDVTLEQNAEARSSARNRLPGTVQELVPRGALVQVVLDVGFRLVSLVTRPAVADLGLRPGVRVWAAFKASTVHLVARPSRAETRPGPAEDPRG